MVKSKLVPFITFYGNEEYLLDREVQRRKRWKDRDVTVLDGRRCTENELLAATGQLTLDGSDTAVVLDYANRVKVGTAFEEYVQLKDLKDTSSILVAILRTDKIPKSWESFASKGKVVKHRKYKSWETAWINKRVQREAGALNLKLDEKASQLLLKVYGDDFRSLVNELQKVTFIVPKDRVVTIDLVRTLCRTQLALQPWDVSEKAAQKSLKLALKYTALLFKYEGDAVAVRILSALMKETEKLLVVRDMLDKGSDFSVIATALSMQEYVVKKSIPVARKHETSKLITQMAMLCQLETQVKGSALSKRTLVELAVHNLAS